MAKKYRSTSVFVKPDVRHKSLLLTKFVNCTFHGGKKSVAERAVYDALDLAQKKIPGSEPLKILEQAIENVRPLLEVRPRRVGGATYQVPMEVPRPRGTALAIRWILEGARARKGRPIRAKLAEELLEAYNKQGTAFTKRENTHKMAEANKAFAHFAW